MNHYRCCPHVSALIFINFPSPRKLWRHIYSAVTAVVLFYFYHIFYIHMYISNVTPYFSPHFFPTLSTFLLELRFMKFSLLFPPYYFFQPFLSANLLYIYKYACIVVRVCARVFKKRSSLMRNFVHFLYLFCGRVFRVLTSTKIPSYHKQNTSSSSSPFTAHTHTDFE